MSLPEFPTAAGRALADLGRQLATQRARADRLQRAVDHIREALDNGAFGLRDVVEAVHDALATLDQDDDPTPAAGPRRTVAPHACSVCRRDDCTTEHVCE